MNVQEILNNIECIKAPVSLTQFSLFQSDESNSSLFFGKDIDGNIVFAMISASPFIQPTYQKTRKLLFWFNIKCNISVDATIKTQTMHVLTCLSDNDDEKSAFIRLTMSFSDSVPPQEPKKMNEVFTSLTNLFANDKSVSRIELQGFYAELFTIRYYAQLNINLYKYWQKKDKLKFDFSLSAKKRIEIKSTTKELRVHHFKHEQLLSDLYDIKIVSYKLRQDDMGISLAKLIEDVQVVAACSFDTLIYIENFIKNVEHDELINTKYDLQYTENHLRFYDSADVPRFLSEQPQGVTQAEYNSDLSTAKTISSDDMLAWIREM